MLLVEIDDETGLHYNLPGGGVEAAESISEALRREVKEETRADVTVGELLWIIEYEPKRNQFWAGKLHKLSLIFACRLQGEVPPGQPPAPDTNQTAVKWVPVSELASIELLPHIGDLIDQVAAGRTFSGVFLEEPLRPESVTGSQSRLSQGAL